MKKPRQPSRFSALRRDIAFALSRHYEAVIVIFLNFGIINIDFEIKSYLQGEFL